MTLSYSSSGQFLAEINVDKDRKFKILITCTLGNCNNYNYIELTYKIKGLLLVCQTCSANF